jgi:hypothetical protein
MAEKLERSILLVPASNWNMIQKTATSNADAVCIDLEDAVTVDEKEASRANVVRAYKELDFGNKLRMYRINGLDTHYAYRDLIEVVEAAGDGIDLIVVPKVNRPEDVYVVETLLTQIESYRQFSRPIGIEALIETAAGCVNIREIAACSDPAGRFCVRTRRLRGVGADADGIDRRIGRQRRGLSRPSLAPHHAFDRQRRPRLQQARHRRAFRRHQESRGLDASLQDRAGHGLRRQMVHSSESDRNG